MARCGQQGIPAGWKNLVLMKIRASLLAVALVGTLIPGLSVPAFGGRSRPADPVVIAIVEDDGMNILHEEFRARPGQ